MSEPTKTEVEVLVEQLEELLAGALVDAEDAYELAVVAGGAARLGADPLALKEAGTWREGAGQLLLAELWQQVDAAPLLEALEGVSEGGATDEEVEEALFDLDDLVAAGIWCGRREAVKATARSAEAIVRALPDVFVDLADVAHDLLRRREVAEELAFYGYWLAVSEAARDRDEG